MAKKKKTKTVLTTYQLFFTLKTIYENDCYLEEFLEKTTLTEFLQVLLRYNIAYIASDDRVLLTPEGEKIFRKLIFAVEFNENETKII